MNYLTPNYYTIKLGKYKFQYTKNAKIGYLVIAMSLEDASMVLQNLSEVLLLILDSNCTFSDCPFYCRKKYKTD
jgi:hypothetical protein